ncbi:MAG: DNA topoisomerase I [Acidilobus sp.]
MPPHACRPYGQYVVIIAEKPKAAARIANALGQPSICRINGVPVYILTSNGQLMVVVSSAGHMFGPTTLVKGLPVTDLRWEPLWAFEYRSRHLKAYYEVLAKILPAASAYVSACDYDIEGSTICYKIIQAFGTLEKARRAKFSSLTEGELRKAFSNLLPLDVNNAMAGIARAELDWLWGINFSRLLMRSYSRAVGERASLSAGRVQTPTLAEAVRRWITRNSYVPVPSVSIAVELSYAGQRFKARPEGWGPRDRDEALKVAQEVRSTGYMTVLRFSQEEDVVNPPSPFNLTDLQEEVTRIYGLSPYRTQGIAEDLYLSALISYPRTESQRLPRDLDYHGILRSLARQRDYTGLVSNLLMETRGLLRPVEGRRTDPAHPAIYPTGEAPSEPLDKYHKAVYDLIVRRFMAAFAPAAVFGKSKAVLMDSQGRAWTAHGVVILKEGWIHYYPFVGIEEVTLPRLEKNARVAVLGVSVRVVWPSSTTRLSRLSLLQWMESNGLGTKGTRAKIIETLLKRGFLQVKGGGLEVTDLGYAVYKALSSMASELVSVDLTREFERKLELIVDGKLSRDEVVSDAKKYVASLVNKYMGLVDQIGRSLAEQAGSLKPRKSCHICGRPADGDLCELHLAALREIERNMSQLQARLGSDRYGVLRTLAKRRPAGRWVREVADYMLKGLK